MTEENVKTAKEENAVKPKKLTVILPDNRKVDLAPELADADVETIQKALRGSAPEIALSKVDKDETDDDGNRTVKFVKEVTRKG